MTKAMLLTAGKGTRLLPLTTKYPKALFPVGDRPCVVYLIELLRDHGIRDLTLNLHHLGDIIRDYLEDGSAFGVKIDYSPEEKLLGTGGGIKKAFSRLGEKSNILVINGDNLIDFDPARLIRFHLAKEALATMLLQPRSGDSPYTPIYINPQSLISQIGNEGEGQAYIFPGTQVLSGEFLQFLKGKKPLCLIRQGYNRVLKEGLPIAGMPYPGYWREIGTKQSYWEANLDFLKGKSPGYFYRGREDFIRRGIHAGKRSQLGQRVNFNYPVYLGEDCKIGANSTLGPNVLIGSGSKIGENCKLDNVLLWPETTLRKNSTISQALVTPFGRIDLKKD